MNATKNALGLAILAATAYFAPAQEVAAYNATLCKAAADTCAATVTGSLLVCAAAAYEAGANPIADIGCSDLAAAARGSCITMGIECAPTNKSQPLTTIIPGGLIGVTTSGTGTTDTTVTCPGSHRVVRFSRYKNSAGATSRLTLICTNGSGIGAGPSPPPSGDTFELSSTCASGRIAQGFTAGRSSGNFTNFTMFCDDVTAAGDATISLGSLPSGGTSTNRMCDETSYVVGMRAFHSGGRLKGVQFLCRAMPK